MRRHCPLQPTFFGLASDYRRVLHSQIFDLVYHGNGGFNWSDVYDMPIWLRHFYIRSIEDLLKKKNAAKQKANKAASKPKGRSTPPKFRR